MRYIVLHATALGMIWTMAALGDEPAKTPKTTRVCAVCQSSEAKDRNLNHVLLMLDQAAAQGAEVVCLPEQCVPGDGDTDLQNALKAISQSAAKHAMLVAVNLNEKDGDRLYSTSYLIGSDGRIIGKYRKSHRLPYESIALGDELPVFETSFGKIGLMIGSDGLWPEVAQVLALQGAELILWSHGPEPVPQGYSLDVLMRVRAFDGHVALAVANYAGELPYLCSRWPDYNGQPLGRACVVDRSGIIRADTGAECGAAVAPIDLTRGTDVYQLTFQGDRTLFRDLIDANLRSAAHRGVKRKIRVAIAQVAYGQEPSPDPNSAFLKAIDEAGRQRPDVIVMAEFRFATDTPEAEKTFVQIAQRAKNHNTYIVIGGLRDPQMPYHDQGAIKNMRASWAYLWDRTGKVVGKYRISQYDGSKELPVFETDFGVVGLILCGDVYSPEICRAMALKGAEIILCGSQSWGASGQWNLWLNQARAIDNAVYMATAHFPFSDIGQRSYVIDPYGFPVAATRYWSDSVAVAEVDLGAGRVWFAPSDQPGKAGQQGYLAGYYPKTIPEKRTDFRSVLFAGRRPELYRPLIDKTLAHRDFPAETWKKMMEPANP